MQRELERLYNKEEVKRRTKEDFISKEPVPLQIKKYLAEKYAKESK